MKPFSIIWLSERRVVRADFKRAGDGPRLVGLVELPAETEPVAGQLASILTSGAGRVRRAFVLTAEATPSVLAVSRDVLQGVPENELGQSLGFEAEAFTGVSAFEAELSFRPLRSDSAERRFWLVQIPTPLNDEIVRAVHDSGARLLGVTHPAGVPRAVTADSECLWSRLEEWHDATATPQRDSSGFDIVLEPGRSGWARDRFAQSAVDATVVERLIDEPELDRDALTSGGETLLNLANEDDLRQWLSAWAAVLSDASPACPLSVPPPRPMSTGLRATIATSLAAVALVACVGMNSLVQSQLEDLDAELTRLNAPQKRYSEVQQQVQELKKQEKSLSEKLEKAGTGSVDLDSLVSQQRQRLSRLFALLAKHHRPELVVQKIDGNGAEVQITGLSLRPEDVQSLAHSLSEGLADVGCLVQATDISAASERRSDGPWSFTISVQHADIHPSPSTGRKG